MVSKSRRCSSEESQVTRGSVSRGSASSVCTHSDVASNARNRSVRNKKSAGQAASNGRPAAGSAPRGSHRRHISKHAEACRSARTLTETSTEHGAGHARFSFQACREPAPRCTSARPQQSLKTLRLKEALPLVVLPQCNWIRNQQLKDTINSKSDNILIIIKGEITMKFRKYFKLT